MKFPISIEVIDDRIYLFQGETTPQFLRDLGIARLAPDMQCDIRSVSQPALETNTIYINGTKTHLKYQIVSRPYHKEIFDRYVKTIEHYKRVLRYDE